MTSKKATKTVPAIVKERRAAAEATADALTLAQTEHDRAVTALADAKAKVAELLNRAEESATAVTPTALRNAEAAVTLAETYERGAARALARAQVEHREANALAVLAEVATDPDLTGEAEEEAVLRAQEAQEQIAAELAQELTRLQRVEADAAQRVAAAGLPSTTVPVDAMGFDTGGQPIKATKRQVALPGRMARQRGPIPRQVGEILRGEFHTQVAQPFDPEMPVTIAPPSDADDESAPDARSGGLNYRREDAPVGGWQQGKQLPGSAVA